MKIIKRDKKHRIFKNFDGVQSAIVVQTWPNNRILEKTLEKLKLIQGIDYVYCLTMDYYRINSSQVSTHYYGVYDESLISLILLSGAVNENS